MKISEAQAAVATFHKKLSLLEHATCERCDDMTLHDVVEILKNQADKLEGCKLPIGMRLHLELEELAEKYEAMLLGDEVKALDGAADQLYVQLGTAAIFDWPLEEAFKEVHRSNMTKERQASDPNAHRVRQKGPRFEAPDIVGVLSTHRPRYFQVLEMEPHLGVDYTGMCLRYLGESAHVPGDIVLAQPELGTLTISRHKVKEVQR